MCVAKVSKHRFTGRNDTISVSDSSDLGWRTSLQVSVGRWSETSEETALDIRLLLMSFTAQYLLSCIGHRFDGVIRNLSMWCVTLSKIRTNWDLLMLISCSVSEPRVGVNPRLCLFHDGINVCYFLFTENGSWPALVVLKWVRMNGADSSVNGTWSCLNGFYKFPPMMDKVKSIKEVSPH